jgi:hypothetical protein
MWGLLDVELLPYKTSGVSHSGLGLAIYIIK